MSDYQVNILDRAVLATDDALTYFDDLPGVRAVYLSFDRGYREARRGSRELEYDKLKAHLIAKYKGEA